MASDAGNSPRGSGMLPQSSAVPLTANDLQRLQVMEERRIKKLMKNRRSARRSWLRQQQKADDLSALVNRLCDENKHLRTNMSKMYQAYFKQATEKSFLRLAANDGITDYGFSSSSYGFYKTKPAVNFAESDQLIEGYYK